MKARLLIHERMVFDDGAILEIQVWRVPEQVVASRHWLKYSLFYGERGKRLIGYDNERGKGDHWHTGSHEEQYRFTSVERLLADFRAEVERLRGEPI